MLNGQKVWTSYAQFADWGLCLARTDPDAPKHQGISYFVVDMRRRASRCARCVQITGEAEFNEVFFDDVFVPDDQLIGPRTRAGGSRDSTLTHERGTNPRQLVIHAQLLEELLAAGRRARRYDDHALQQRLAQAYVEVRLFQLHNWRIAVAARQGARSSGPRAARSSSTGAR